MGVSLASKWASIINFTMYGIRLNFKKYYILIKQNY